MEDLEFSVEICDSDWQHFFEMCEECDLHPPSLATADDSGLSDCDHTKSTLAESAQEVYLTRRYSLDAISNCKDLVVETQLGEQAAGEMESILSGSEEDIHLQSVNMFFERMANQANVGKSKGSKQEDGLCSNGMEPSSKLPAGDETIVLEENDLDKMNTFKKAQPSSYTLHDLPACSAPLKNDRSTHTESFISIQTETKTNETNPHKSDDSFNLHNSQRGRVSTKEAHGPPSSAMATMKRRRRKKRCHGIESTQSRHERSNDEEQSLFRFYRDLKPLYSNEPQKTDALVTTMVPCGGTCHRESRFSCRDSERNDELMCLQCFHHPDCEDQFNLEVRRLKVQATSEGADWDDGDDMDGVQGDTLSAAKSVHAAEALHSGRDKGTGCQRQAETQQQLEMEADNLDQNSHEFMFTSHAQKSTFPNTELQKCEITVSSVDETVSEVTCAELTANFTELSAHKRHLSERPSSLALTEAEYHAGNPKCDDEDREISSFVGPFSDNKNRGTNPELSLFEDTGPVLSNVNIAGSCSSPSPDPDPVNRCGSIITTHKEEAHGTGQTNDFKAEDDDVISTSRDPEYVPDSKHPVFVMSSFWSEMEKLTINDIMGLRKTNKETDESNPSLSSQSVESKPLPAGEDTDGDFDAVPSNPDSTSPKCVLLWESEPVDIITEKAEEAPFSGSPRHGSPPKGLRRISKNASVHNLRALDSLEPCSKAKKAHILQTLEELEVKEVKKHSLASTHCRSFSLYDVFQFLLGGKQQIHSQSAKDDIVNFNTDGKSVPETYDHFFAEFGIENFFYPFVTEEKHSKTRSVISGQTKMHLPEAYDYFFASSSSDDSVGEEEEESGSPMRVVSRLSQNSNTTQTFADDYENFFCDSDTRENFFWTATFSFRNFHLSRGAVWNKRSIPSSLGHVGRNVQNAPTLRDLGHTGLTHLLSQQRENRITRSILTQPLGYEDMQGALPNPRTDVSLLPLRQSDMCLVCIAFASWVLKTANPQVGDMWKAVLLANLSALSAIRYLRKDVKVEVAAGQKKQHLTTLSGT
ncbi:uncharacterized protein perm1a [Hippocampus comes]|nr:PREDICTED: PGC-1 and ERR-induced regulator in muscle protein 1 [Hippocampus comes]